MLTFRFEKDMQVVNLMRINSLYFMNLDLNFLTMNQMALIFEKDKTDFKSKYLISLAAELMSTQIRHQSQQETLEDNATSTIFVTDLRDSSEFADTSSNMVSEALLSILQTLMNAWSAYFLATYSTLTLLEISFWTQELWTKHALDSTGSKTKESFTLQQAQLMEKLKSSNRLSRHNSKKSFTFQLMTKMMRIIIPMLLHQHCKQMFGTLQQDLAKITVLCILQQQLRTSHQKSLRLIYKNKLIKSQLVLQAIKEL